METTIVTKTKTKTAKGYDDYVGMMIGMNIDYYSENDELTQKILDNMIIIIPEDETTEELYFVGTIEESKILECAIKDIANTVPEYFEILDIQVNTTEILKITEYVKEEIQNAIDENIILRNYIINNMSKDTILDKMLEGMELTNIDKQILAK